MFEPRHLTFFDEDRVATRDDFLLVHAYARELARA